MQQGSCWYRQLSCRDKSSTAPTSHLAQSHVCSCQYTRVSLCLWSKVENKQETSHPPELHARWERISDGKCLKSGVVPSSPDVSHVPAVHICRNIHLVLSRSLTDRSSISLFFAASRPDKLTGGKAAVASICPLTCLFLN